MAGGRFAAPRSFPFRQNHSRTDAVSRSGSKKGITSFQGHPIPQSLRRIPHPLAHKTSGERLIPIQCEAFPVGNETF
jgi:hypothetical protein